MEDPPANRNARQEQPQHHHDIDRDDLDHHMAAALQAVHPPFHSMQLTEQECRWALAIRNVVKEDEDLEKISDMEYAHHALLARGNVEQAVARIRGMQYFRQEYNIKDTAEEGIQLLEQFMRKHPGFVLSVDYDAAHGHFIIVYDYAKRNPSAIDFPHDWRVHLGGFFYLFQAMQSNIVSMREGLVHICECEGMGWDNFSMEHVRRSFSDLYEHYPLEHKEISWIRTPMVANLLHAFMKPLIRPETRRKFRIGCNFYGYDGRIDTIFNIPTADAARENLMRKLHGYLETRYHNQSVFRLPHLPPLDDDEEELLDDDEDDEDVDVDNDNDNDDMDI